MLSLLNFCKLKCNCFTFSNSSENIAILCSLLSKAIRFLPVNFLFDSKTLIVLLESLFSSLSVDFNWYDCNWEFKISIYLKSGYLFFVLESTLKKELVIENVRAICCIVPKNIYSFWIKLFCCVEAWHFGFFPSGFWGAMEKESWQAPVVVDWFCLFI
jgi:hypothetical protein